MSLYIHIPFCISKCAYCDFFSKPYPEVYDDYIDALCNELEYRFSLYKISRLNTIYIGGGTPSLLKPHQFQKLFEKIRNCVQINTDTEITVEVNPDDVREEFLKILSGCGVNRISCGIQSMNNAALNKACRRADAETNKRALELLRDSWDGEVSLDLISGLPEDDEEALINSLTQVCSINPSHVSLYSLTIEETTPFGKQLENGTLSYDFDKADKLWLAGRDFLLTHGYQWYEVSNFCKPGKECRHNLTYWNHKNYLGAGSGATGTVYNKDGSGFRWTNTTDVDAYITYWLNAIPESKNKEVTERNRRGLPLELPQLSESIDLPTSEFEFFMMGLRKLTGISEGEFEAAFGKKLPEQFVSLFTKWEKRGLCVRRPDGRLCMSRQGILFLNRFLEELC
ncbi:oxygen-independent coproporphyrinogen-3 oxidase [Treponema bryantii]|uniref:Heme chaperone HemW n=1 Tax=Treponema bryantii TaxID=163 RepID=A0A1I3IU57_9SPIR|nr:radical SAM family heme chaperone HemW [Treponema bryantii]SFI51417.1 oxygen-independent coproporphyrinogen-3 oxidase [Treponema bryantii]